MQKKTHGKNTKMLRIAFVVNGIFLFFIALGFGREYIGNMQIEHEIAKSEEERSRLEQENLSMNQLIQELSSEYFLETEARIKHGLAEEGETLVVIQEGDPIYVPTVIEEEDERVVSKPMKWYFYFFDHATFLEVTSNT